MNNRLKFYKNLLPGITLSVVIMIISLNVAKMFPVLGGATYAIILGIVLGNTFFKQPSLKKGTAFCEKRLLEFSVFFLGYSISVASFTQIGFSGLFIIVFMLVSTLVFVQYRGRVHGVSRGMSQLLAAGNAICGSSAVAAVSDVVDVSEDDRSNSIVLINVSGTILMLSLPVICAFIFKDNALHSGLIIGSIVQSVGQVAGAGSQMGADVLEIAMITKIIRVMMLVFVVIYFSSQNVSKEEGPTKRSITKYVPWYIIGFVVLFAVRLIFGVNEPTLVILKQIGNYCELTALAAIGLRLDLQKLLANSRTLLIYTMETLVFQLVVSLGLIFILFKIL